jgi:hypothetical protein
MNTKSNKSVLSVPSIQSATSAVNKLRESMPFLIEATPTERRAFKAARLGPKTLRALENRILAVQQHPELLPLAFDVKAFERDASLTLALIDCIQAIERVRDSVMDTMLSVGAQANQASAIAYAHIRVASNLGVNVNRLSVVTRRSKRNSSADSPTDSPVTPLPTTDKEAA